MVHELNFSIKGNTIPPSWYRTMVFQTKKRQPNPHLLAINFLADLVKWYSPIEKFDAKGKIIGWEKLFNGRYMERSFQDICDFFGCSEKQARDMVNFLECRGLVFRHYLDEPKQNGLCIVPFFPMIKIHTFGMEFDFNFVTKENDKYFLESNGVETIQSAFDSIGDEWSCVATGSLPNSETYSSLPNSEGSLKINVFNNNNYYNYIILSNLELLNIENNDSNINENVIDNNYSFNNNYNPNEKVEILLDGVDDIKNSLKKRKKEKTRPENGDNVAKELPLWNDDWFDDTELYQTIMIKPKDFQRLQEAQLAIRCFLMARYHYLKRKFGKTPTKDELYINFQGKEAGQMVNIRKQLKKKAEQAQFDWNGKIDFIQKLLKPWLNAVIELDDDFLCKHFTPSWLYGRFDQIYYTLKTNKNDTKKKATSAINDARQKLRESSFAIATGF